MYQPICTIRQLIAVSACILLKIYVNVTEFSIGDGGITDWNWMTGSDVVFCKPITTREHSVGNRMT